MRTRKFKIAYVAGIVLLVDGADLDFLSEDRLSVCVFFHSPPGVTRELREVHGTQGDAGLKAFHHPGPH